MNEISPAFKLDKAAGYFRCRGVNVMAFDDFYPAGHQSGVSLLMHGKRVATNGDIRFEQTPGQWQPLPKQGRRTLDEDSNTIETELSYPDLGGHLQGFNPMIYPDFEFSYRVTVRGEGDGVTVCVDLDRPVPERFLGKLCFNLELFPGELFGKSYLMDDACGIFPRQPNGPTLSMPSNLDHTGTFAGHTPKTDITHLADRSDYNPITADDLIAVPYAVGRTCTVRPEDRLYCFTVESMTADIKLYDGRMNHNNGWFVLSSEVPADVTENAIVWKITPCVDEHWLSPAVVQISQVGYHPAQPKQAVIELDPLDDADKPVRVLRITKAGEECVLETRGEEWGRFLRYHYLTLDFSCIRESGLYRIAYGDACSSVFRIAEDVYERGVWQPVLEYFLPVQMCHMRVNEKYRVWHGLCHNYDARMAKTANIHIDGYEQGPETLTRYRPGDFVPGLNVGGWHDAGDYDLRVESQSGEVYILSAAYEAFHVDYDATTIDQTRKVTEIHCPDGKNDILQQIEHGTLSVVAGYRALGRLYRGIISNKLRQYVLLGDGSTMTDGIPGNDDDRWVFTENNPPRELSTAANLAAAARVLRGFNDTLAEEALAVSEALFARTDAANAAAQKLHAACELYRTTGKDGYRAFILDSLPLIKENAERVGWFVCRVLSFVNDSAFTDAVRQALAPLTEHYTKLSAETPYGIPYRPHIWGAGWDIQSLGFRYFFMHEAFPDLFRADMIYHALDFILGCHPGSNTASFASGVGTKSATVAYGANRGDWSYIPGGVVSGTALIRPDFPELLEFPFLWQQTEYVLGGGSSHYMFLVLAVRHLLGLGEN
ncbi:MAG: glycoside hydrolase family 9 protein [Clostridia bacterium]|nr:glycoside hydrolase family 9 protein [Clostridia bacterium]